MNSNLKIKKGRNCSDAKVHEFKITSKMLSQIVKREFIVAVHDFFHHEYVQISNATYFCTTIQASFGLHRKCFFDSFMMISIFFARNLPYGPVWRYFERIMASCIVCSSIILSWQRSNQVFSFSNFYLGQIQRIVDKNTDLLYILFKKVPYYTVSMYTFLVWFLWLFFQ